MEALYGRVARAVVAGVADPGQQNEGCDQKSAVNDRGYNPPAGRNFRTQIVPPALGDSLYRVRSPGFLRRKKFVWGPATRLGAPGSARADRTLALAFLPRRTRRLLRCAKLIRGRRRPPPGR